MPVAKNEYAYIPDDLFERIIAPAWGRGDAMYAVMFSIMRYRGLSPLDVCRLRIQDIADDHFVLQRHKTNYASLRRMSPRAQERLRWWIEQHTHNQMPLFREGYLFGAQNGKYAHVQPCTLRCKWRDYVRLSGVKSDFVVQNNPGLPHNPERPLHMMRLYDLRASFGTDIAIWTHGNVYAVSAALGHTDIRASIRYVRMAQIVLEVEAAAQRYTAIPVPTSAWWRKELPCRKAEAKSCVDGAVA